MMKMFSPSSHAAQQNSPAHNPPVLSQSLTPQPIHNLREELLIMFALHALLCS